MAGLGRTRRTAPRPTRGARCLSGAARQACMSVIASDWAYSLVHTHPDVKMTQAEFNVLSRLAAKQHPVTGECQISECEIATSCRLSKTHVGRCLRALRKIEALASWEQGKSKFWASKFTFGLGFAFVPLCTSDPATV